MNSYSPTTFSLTSPNPPSQRNRLSNTTRVKIAGGKQRKKRTSFRKHWAYETGRGSGLKEIRDIISALHVVKNIMSKTCINCKKEIIGLATKYCSKECYIEYPPNKAKRHADNVRASREKRISRNCLHCDRPTWIQTALWCKARRCREAWVASRKETAARPLTDEVVSWCVS